MTQITSDFSLSVDENITLKLPLIEESEIFFALTNKNRAYLRHFFGWVDEITTVDDAEFFIRIELMKSVAMEEISLAIWFKGYPVGCLSLQNIDKIHHSARIGYWIDKEHQGRGIITKSLNKLIEFSFKHLSLHRIEALCAVHNVKSQQIPLRLNFKLEGTLKDALFHQGKYFDAHLYAITKES